MVGCAAYNCFNNSRNKTKNQDHLPKKKETFHKFPKNATLQKIWIQNMRLASFVLQPYSRHCQEHFTEESYQRGPNFFEVFRLRELEITFGRLFLTEGHQDKGK